MREGGEDGEGGGRGTGFAWQEGDFSPCSAPSLSLHTQPCCALQLRAGSGCAHTGCAAPYQCPTRWV